MDDDETTEIRSNTRAMPREDLFRMMAGSEAVALRAAGDDEPLGMPTLTGHFVVFNTWTEINSMWEGNFLERFAPGSVKKTLKEGRARLRCLFQHGMDPVVADKPLGQIERAEEDETGGVYDVPMFDTAYNRELIPGLESGVYGASFRFRALREEWVEEPEPSDANPKGLPERTVLEAQVVEFGPVTFPAYADATAGVRSVTDDFIIARLGGPEQLEKLIEDRRQANEDSDPTEGRTAPSAGDAETPTAPSHLTDERRENPAPPTGKRAPIIGTRRKEKWYL